MLARRVCANVRNTFPAQHPTIAPSRSFAAATAILGPARSPALADITPDSARSFSEKQKEFREGLVTAQKQKEQQESAYNAHNSFALHTAAGFILVSLGDLAH